MTLTRRSAIEGGILAALVRPLQAAQGAPSQPVAIASANGLLATHVAVQAMGRGTDTLDAAIAGVKIQEDDPNDSSVGYGGLPNEEGIVELDASVMHGPSRRAGAVAALRGIKNPSMVAKVVMERTDHLLLVGAGALRFALAHGFKEENLLTEKSRLAWLTWKETMSGRDGWGPGLASPDSETEKKGTPPGDSPLAAWAREVALNPPTGTINCLALNTKGEISGVTTTSGLAWKIPGRVGDSPLIGCGLFVDNDIGGAGSTGRGEECIKVNGAHTVVEMMRRGASPRDACLEALKRVAANYQNRRDKLEKFDLNFYALNKRGEHGAAALWNVSASGKRKPQYALNDGGGASRLIPSAWLLER